VNEQDIAARVHAAQNIARQEQAKLGKVEACDPPMGIDTPPKLPAWHDVLCDAEQVVRQKPIFGKYIKGTILENDVPVWMATFAQQAVMRERARSALGTLSADGRASLRHFLSAALIFPTDRPLGEGDTKDRIHARTLAAFDEWFALVDSNLQQPAASLVGLGQGNGLVPRSGDVGARIRGNAARGEDAERGA
jgi:hypothetical protein